MLSLKNGVFVLNFQSEGGYMKALEQPPWLLGSKMMFLRPWSPEMQLKRLKLTAMPVWIRLPHLKLHYYTVAGLSKLASYIGKPLYTDQQTASQGRESYARICVELEPGEERINSIPYENEFGQIEYQEVQYEWIPPCCMKCKVFGHKQRQCSTGKGKQMGS